VLSIPFSNWPPSTSYGRLQREFLGTILPAAVRLRAKAVFSSGIAYRMRLAWPRLRSLFFEGEWRSERFVRRDVAKALIGRGEESTDRDDWRLWRAIWAIGTLEAWLRMISGYAYVGRRT